MEQGNRLLRARGGPQNEVTGVLSTSSIRGAGLGFVLLTMLGLLLYLTVW